MNGLNGVFYNIDQYLLYLLYISINDKWPVSQQEFKFNIFRPCLNFH